MTRPSVIAQFLIDNQARWLDLLKAIVSIDSSHAGDPVGVNQVQDHIAGYLKQLGIESTQTPTPVGNILLAKTGSQGPKILCLGHVDTVLPPDGNLTWHDAPAEDRIYGSGTMDMKGGDAYMIAIAETAKHFDMPVQLTLMLVPDEETGSHHSRAAMEAIAREHDYCIVFEATEAPTDYVKSRKTGLHTKHVFQKLDSGGFLKLFAAIAAMDALTNIEQGGTVCPILSAADDQPPRANVVPDVAYIGFEIHSDDLHDWYQRCDQFFEIVKKPLNPEEKTIFRLDAEDHHRVVYTYGIIGKKAHAGNNLHEGVNAWVQLARHIEHLQTWLKKYPQHRMKITGIVGSTRLSASACLQLDLRANTLADLKANQQAILELIKSSGLSNRLDHPFEIEAPSRPAMLASDKLEAAIAQVKLPDGSALTGVHRGGMSDGNITSEAGCPSTDGWGPLGAGLHTYGEYIVRSQWTPRLQLATTLVQQLIGGHGE